MKLPQYTQHGSRTTGDALELFADETTLIDELSNAWKVTTPDRSMGDKVVTAKWDHGTIGKLLLEHTAVRLAASEDLARALSEGGRDAVASQLVDENKAVRPLLDQMYDSARGCSRSRSPSRRALWNQQTLSWRSSGPDWGRLS